MPANFCHLIFQLQVVCTVFSYSHFHADINPSKLSPKYFFQDQRQILLQILFLLLFSRPCIFFYNFELYKDSIVNPYSNITALLYLIEGLFNCQYFLDWILSAEFYQTFQTFLEVKADINRVTYFDILLNLFKSQKSCLQMALKMAM